jgi:hypothetical protein
MSDAPLEALKTPLGTFEPNVLLAGLEGIVAIWVGYVLISGAPSFVPSLLRPEQDWGIAVFAVYALLALVAIVLVGLVVEGLAGATERLVTWTSFNSHELRPRFWVLFGEPPDPSAWDRAQKWIWKSPEARDEFARRRLRLLVARNTTFVLFSATLAIAGGILVVHPADQLCRLAIVLGSGPVATGLFTWVWIAAQQGYNAAVQDADRIGDPPS